MAKDQKNQGDRNRESTGAGNTRTTPSGQPAGQVNSGNQTNDATTPRSRRRNEDDEDSGLGNRNTNR